MYICAQLTTTYRRSKHWFWSLWQCWTYKAQFKKKKKKEKSFLPEIHHYDDGCFVFCSIPGSKQIPNFFQINFPLKCTKLKEPKQKHDKDPERTWCLWGNIMKPRQHHIVLMLALRPLTQFLLDSYSMWLTSGINASFTCLVFAFVKYLKCWKSHR